MLPMPAPSASGPCRYRIGHPPPVVGHRPVAATSRCRHDAKWRDLRRLVIGDRESGGAGAHARTSWRALFAVHNWRETRLSANPGAIHPKSPCLDSVSSSHQQGGSTHGTANHQDTYLRICPRGQSPALSLKGSCVLLLIWGTLFSFCFEWYMVNFILFSL